LLLFPIIAIAVALIVIGRGASKQFFDERPRDQIARRVCLVLGIVILVIYAISWLTYL
jgi:hypothetical protein